MALAEADRIIDKYRFRPGYAAFQTRQREAIHRGWTERRQTDPKQMVSSLRYAARVEGSGYSKDGSFLLPYHKLINREAHQLWLRHFDRSFQEEWSIDFGNLVGDKFLSRGWVDFNIGKPTYKQDKMGLEGLVASASWHGLLHGNVHYPEPAVRDRFGLSYRDREFSLFVDPKLRGQKIGLSLVNAARVVTAERGANSLLIDEGITIHESRDKSGEGFLGFLANLGYPALYEYPEYASISNQITVIPTQDRVGQRQNYSFDYPVPPGSYPYKFI